MKKKIYRKENETKEERVSGMTCSVSILISCWMTSSFFTFDPFSSSCHSTVMVRQHKWLCLGVVLIVHAILKYTNHCRYFSFVALKPFPLLATRSLPHKLCWICLSHCTTNEELRHILRIYPRWFGIWLSISYRSSHPNTSSIFDLLFQI